jgi:alpha-galactosidase
LDFKVHGEDGYPLLRKKLRGRPLTALIDRLATDAHGWQSRSRLASDLFAHYGYLPYVADRHTSEFFASYMSSEKMLARYNIARTTIAERAVHYDKAAQWIQDVTDGKAEFGTTPSRETAADIIAAITFDKGFTDVVNMSNLGQIPNLPAGCVVETMGYVDRNGTSPLTAGPLPEPLRDICGPHAEVQLRTVAAALAGDLEEALMALVADPVCALLPASDVKKMGRELLEANKEYLPQFFRK